MENHLWPFHMHPIQKPSYRNYRQDVNDHLIKYTQWGFLVVVVATILVS